MKEFYIEMGKELELYRFILLHMVHPLTEIPN